MTSDWMQARYPYAGIALSGWQDWELSPYWVKIIRDVRRGKLVIRINSPFGVVKQHYNLKTFEAVMSVKDPKTDKWKAVFRDTLPEDKRVILTA